MRKTMESNDQSSGKTIRLRGKNQVTLPAQVVEDLHLTEGDQFEVTIDHGRIVFVPVVTTENDQAWFWTTSWQQAEQEVEEQIEEGELSDVMSMEETIQWLHTSEEET